MGTGFEDVRPYVVEQMDESVLTTETLNSQGYVLDGCCSSLSVDQISISEGVLKQRSNCVDVIFGHFSDVLEHEGHTF